MLNWFARGGADYARYRPEYPAVLLDYLLSITPAHHHALDVGCGTGQLTTLLACAFDKVTGIDPSQTQIDNAQSHPRVDYCVGPAEELPHALHDINLITVAQAAHWFDLPAFYREAQRVAGSDAVIALISYGVLNPDETLRARFRRFYYDEIGLYWPAERQLVDNGYAGILFPFTEMSAPDMEIRLQWDLAAMMGYVSTWSAVKRALDAGQDALLVRFYDDIRELWGDPAQKRTFSWPINIRAGRLRQALYA